MNKPCEHCEKADKRRDYFKCDNPCNNAKQCYENDKKMIDVLKGFMPEVKMSDDLISRKALMYEIEKSMNFNPHEDSKIALNHRNEHIHFLSIALKIPTAYDVDAVISEISSCFDSKKEVYTDIDSDEEFWKSIAYQNAIDIVRNGGNKE